MFDWDVADIDQVAADKLILIEVRRALDELERKLLGLTVFRPWATKPDVTELERNDRER